MLSKDDNEILCRVGPGTPMGNLLRQYWFPAMPSYELPSPDSPPKKLRLLGEDLIAFRDSTGAVGVLANACPHRGASLYFGRNEEAGLRCVYHGWKFDGTGQCIDLPNTPEGDTFKNKIKITAYACEEAGGMVFAYMGPKDKQPPFPEFDFRHVPPENTYVTKFQLECNWLQATEGDFDPSHGVFLHSTLDNNRSNPQRQFQGIPNQLTGIAQPNLLEGPVPEEEPFPFAVGNRRFKKDDRRAHDRLQEN